MATGYSYQESAPEFITKEFTSEWKKVQLKHANGIYATSYALLNDWRFSPGGKVAVALEEHPTDNDSWLGFALYFYDVHNKLWFGQPFSAKSEGIMFEDIFTYHMLDENTVVVVEMKVYNQVKQHIIKVDMENHTADLVETIIHDFLPRTAEADQPNWVRPRKVETPVQHVPVKLKDQYYTALVGRKEDGEERKIVYLVPRNPQDSNIKPMEFSVPTTLSTVNKDQLNQVLEGQKYNRYGIPDRHNFVFCGTSSSSHVLKFVANVSIYTIEGVYLTIDLSKLIDIYNKPIEAMEQKTRDIQQADAISLIVQPNVKTHTRYMDFSCGLEGSLDMYQSSSFVRRYNTPRYNSQEIPRELSCHFSESNRVIETKTCVYSWFVRHPCGAVLQFYMTFDRRDEFHMRVVTMYKNTLKSLASTKLIFEDPNGRIRINSINRLHQMIYNGEQPVKLKEEATEIDK